MKKIICLNGPPGSGKDTIANFIVNKYNAEHLKFADPIRKSVCALLDINNDIFDKVKDSYSLNSKKNYTIRDLMIDIGENIIKKKISKNWISVNLCERIMKSNSNLFVISDLGFDNELDELYDKLEDYSFEIQIWKIYRKGKNFKKDSRDYVKNNNTINILNNDSIEELNKQVVKLMNR